MSRLKEFTQFSSDLDESTKKQLNHGQILMELLKQPLNHPMSQSDQILSLVIADADLFSGVDIENLKEDQNQLLAWINENHPEFASEINTTKVLDENLKSRIIEAAKEYRGN